MSIAPKYRRPLSEEQIEILELLYKFRFASNNLIADYYGKSSRGFVFNRMKILQEQGYVDKRSEKEWRILGKPMAYYLTSLGARKLQEYREENDPINTSFVYKNKAGSERLITHSLHIFNLYNKLMDQYGDNLEFLTKTDLAGTPDYPSPLPDVFASFNNPDGKSYFIEVIEENQPFFTIIRRINYYFDYKDSGDWTATGMEFPTTIFACESPSLEKRVKKQADRMIAKRIGEEIDIQVTLLAEPKLLS